MTKTLRKQLPGPGRDRLKTATGPLLQLTINQAFDVKIGASTTQRHRRNEGVTLSVGVQQQSMA